MFKKFVARPWRDTWVIQCMWILQVNIRTYIKKSVFRYLYYPTPWTSLPPKTWKTENCLPMWTKQLTCQCLCFDHYQSSWSPYITYLSTSKTIYSTMSICYCKRASRTSYAHADCAHSGVTHIYAGTHRITFARG